MPNASTFGIRITEVENGYTVVLLLGGAAKKTWVAVDYEALLRIIRGIMENRHG